VYSRRRSLGSKARERLLGQVAREQVVADIAVVVGDGPWLHARAKPSDPVRQVPPKRQALVVARRVRSSYVATLIRPTGGSAVAAGVRSGGFDRRRGKPGVGSYVEVRRVGAARESDRS
jgi:hypothetical protein